MKITITSHPFSYNFFHLKEYILKKSEKIRKFPEKVLAQLEKVG